MKNKDKTRPRKINKVLSSLPISHSGLGPTSFSIAASSFVATRSSTSGFSTSEPSASHSNPASSSVSVSLFYLISFSPLGHAFYPIVSPSRAFITSKGEQRRCVLFLQENDFIEENFVSPSKISLKRSQKEVNNINRKKLQYQLMATTRKEKTVYHIFSYYAYSPKVKLNTN